MKTYEFRQVDVFSATSLKGNPLAVVIGADGLSDNQMAQFANWTNLSETTFLLRPEHPDADYRVRIFTPTRELPFAGHPTLGSCHVWLTSQKPGIARDIVQECAAGLIRIRQAGTTLSFAAPPLQRFGPIDPDLHDVLRTGLGLEEADVVDASWIDNGPGWIGMRLTSSEAVLRAAPDYARLAGNRVGLIGATQETGAADFEVRAFTAGGYEDPVTGSLQAGLAQWLIGNGTAPQSYVARQGTVLGRCGYVHVKHDGDTIWVGGSVTPAISGTLFL